MSDAATGWPPVADDVLQRAATVRAVVFDVDGVLTDGRIYLDERGRESRAFHARDGLGIVMALRAGLEVGVISGRNSPLVRTRMDALGVRHVMQGISDKSAALDQLLARIGIAENEACAVGDDVIDLPILRRVSLAVAVADAHRLVRAQAHHVTCERGGRGAAREVTDLLLRARGALVDGLAHYLGEDAARDVTAALERR